MSDNILSELKKRIDKLRKSKEEIVMELQREKSDLEITESKLNSLKSEYEMKKLKINDMNAKIHEKSTLISEAEKAYTKLVENASKLIEAIDHNENDGDDDN